MGWQASQCPAIPLTGVCTAVPSVALHRTARPGHPACAPALLSPRHPADRTRGGEAVADMAAFARAGITSLDTADNYGPAEALVGKGKGKGGCWG